MNDNLRYNFLQISTDVLNYIPTYISICPLWNHSLSKSCTKSNFFREKSLMIALVNWERAFLMVLHSKLTSYWFISKVQTHLLLFWIGRFSWFWFIFSNGRSVLIFVCWRQIVLSVFDHLVGLALKGLTEFGWAVFWLFGLVSTLIMNGQG